MHQNPPLHYPKKLAKINDTKKKKWSKVYHLSRILEIYLKSGYSILDFLVKQFVEMLSAIMELRFFVQLFQCPSAKIEYMDGSLSDRNKLIKYLKGNLIPYCFHNTLLLSWWFNFTPSPVNWDWFILLDKQRSSYSFYKIWFYMD